MRRTELGVTIFGVGIEAVMLGLNYFTNLPSWVFLFGLIGGGLLMVGGMGLAFWRGQKPEGDSAPAHTQPTGSVGRDNIQIQNFYYGHWPAQEEKKMSDESNQQPRIHVESHNQQGGITAYQVNIQPGDRQLSANVAKQLKGYLGKTSFKNIEVNAVMGDGEAFRFASQIKNFLISEGFKVEGVNQVMYSAPVQGQIIEPPNDAGLIRIIVGNR